MSKRNGYVTRTAYVYDYKIISRAPRRIEYFTVYLTSRDDERAEKEIRKAFPAGEVFVLRALYEDVYGMDPAIFYDRAELLTRKTVTTDGYSI